MKTLQNFFDAVIFAIVLLSIAFAITATISAVSLPIKDDLALRQELAGLLEEVAK
jgi:hypothetical protein